MIVEIGHFALVLALATAIIVSVLPLIGVHRRDASMMAVATTGSLVMFGLVALSFAALTWAYVVSDFSVKNVWENYN
jgi:cytochrome c-type biogenesis protein CcmF